jgi:hypothetical protein
MKRFRFSGLAASAIGLASLAVSATGDARVRLEGQWPDADKPVSLEASGVPRTQALRKLADAAGWSLVVRGPAGDPVDVHVKGQPASKVLGLLLDDGDYVARRDGTLVSIEREGAMPTDAPATAPLADAAASAVPSGASPSPAPPPPALGGKKHRGDRSAGDAQARAQDRTVMGGSVHIRKGEAARDVTVFGGSVLVDGDVTGDVSVFGGSVEVSDGGRIGGDATVFGGRLTLANGSRVEGDVNAIGGTLERAPGAQVGGSVGSAGGDDDDDDDDDDDTAPSAHQAGDDVQPPSSLAARTLKRVTHGLRLAAVLYVIGTLILALAGRRMTTLRAEMAARPMRSLALGLVGTLSFVLVLVALCVTVIGIPIAIVALLMAIFAVLGAMAAVLGVAGEGLLRHRTENPYVHLAVGCALFVAVSWVPWVGGVVDAALVLAAIGVLVATRCAGLLARRNGQGGVYPVSES